MKKFLLRIIEGNNPDTTFEINEGITYEIRRALPMGIPSEVDRKNAIFIQDTEISKLHAKISIIGGELIIQDLNSTNGVYLNNKRIKKALVMSNDKIKIGTTVLKANPASNDKNADLTFIGANTRYSKPTHDFKNFAKSGKENITFDPFIKPETLYPLSEGYNEEVNALFLKIHNLIENIPRNETEEASSKPVDGYMFSIKIIDGENAGEERNFYRKSIIIGRTGDLNLKDESISREHAKITVQGDGIYKVQDLGTQNGTFINNTKIHTSTFKKGDILKVGNVSLAFSAQYEEF